MSRGPRPAERPVPPAPRLLHIAAPMGVELVLGIGVGVLGTWMAARLSDTDGAAFALSQHVLGMLFVVFRIVGAGIGVVVAQSLGGGRRDTADAVARATLGASTWVGLGTAALAALGAVPLLRLLNAPPDVLPRAAPFLVMLAPAVLLDAWNACMASVMRAHLRVRETLAVIVCMHLALLAGALLLMPRWGLPGYALSLSASRLLGLLLHRGLWRERLGLRPRAHDWWRLSRGALAPVLRIGLPGAAENIAWRLAFLVSVAVVGQMGGTALATQSYALQVNYVVLLAGLATGLSAAGLLAMTAVIQLLVYPGAFAAQRVHAGADGAMDTLAVVLQQPEQLSLARLALTAPGAADVVVDIDYSGISTGTEKLLWSGRMPHFPGMGYPLVPGYESVGRVVQAGPDAGIAEGEQVFVPGANCFGPVRGLFGGAARRLVVPGRRVVPVSEALGERAVLLALAATAYHAVSGAGVQYVK